MHDAQVGENFLKFCFVQIFLKDYHRVSPRKAGKLATKTETTHVTSSIYYFGHVVNIYLTYRSSKIQRSRLK